MEKAPVSPIKGLSVREDANGRPALHKKVGKNKYVCLANFYFRIEAFVKFSDIAHRKYNGYILFVQRVDGVSMECYVTVEEIESVKKFKAAINRTFADKGGVIWQGINDMQLSTYVMDKLKEFAQSSEAKKLQGALVIGRQPNFRRKDANGCFIDDPENDPGIEMDGNIRKVDDFDSSVYVFNEDVQMDKDGIVEQYKYKWMVPLLKSMPAAMADKHINNYLEGYPVQIDLPLAPFDWLGFICQAKTFFKSNFMPFLMLLCGGISAFHFQKIISQVGCCPVATAIGDISSGKSTSLQVASKMMGMHMVSQSSGEYVCSDLAKTAIPLSWDDPTHPTLVRQPLMSVFNGFGSQTKSRGNEKPLTSFLLTVNFKMDDDMRSCERTTPIWFQKLITSVDDVGAGMFMDARRDMLEVATTNCLLDIIRLNEKVNEINLSSHISFFEGKLVGLSPRLPNIYSVYRLFAYEVVDLVDDCRVLSTTDIDSYLNSHFVPFVMSMYIGSAQAHTSFEEFFRLLVQAILKLALTQDELSKWMKPLMKGRRMKIDYLAFILPKAIKTIGQAGLPKAGETNIRELAKNMENANVNHKANFAGMNGKVSCIKVARSSLPKDSLEEIDKVFELSDNQTNDDSEGDNDEVSSKGDKAEECTKCENFHQEMENMGNSLQTLRAKHNEELTSLKKENIVLKNKHMELERDGSEMKRQIAFLSDMLREANKKKVNVSPGQVKGNSVTMSIARIVEPAVHEDNNASQICNLNDSGVGQELETGGELEGCTPSTSQKRTSDVQQSANNRCNLCTKKKIANMVMCTNCCQWQHCSCVGMSYKEAKATHETFCCKDCQ